MSIESKTSSQYMKSEIVTVYAAGGEEAVSGVKARRLDTRFTAAGAGTIENPNAGTMDLATKEHGTGVFYVAADGRYLGGSATGVADATLSSAMLPQPIPIRIERQTKVTVIQ
jgi:hypothetical protein